MRVLLVEDEASMAKATALELLSVDAYDIAVLDRDIPGAPGTRSPSASSPAAAACRSLG
jgi:hypothetical protein